MILLQAISPNLIDSRDVYDAWTAQRWEETVKKEDEVVGIEKMNKNYKL